MLGALFPAAIDHGAHNQRHADLSGEQVAPIGGLINDWVDCQEHKIHAGVKHDGTHAGERRAYGEAGDGVLRDRAVEYTAASEFAVQTLEAASGVPGAPQALSDHEYAPVVRQQLR